MKAIFRILLILPVLGLAVTGGLAHRVSDIQKRELVQLVGDLNRAAQRKDASLIVNNMPARLYKEMAIRMHTTEADLRENLKVAVHAQFSQLGDDGYRLDAAAIEYAETKDGTLYALVPTRVKTDKNITEFMTLALYDNTKWHLIYGGQKTIQNSVFLEIYPAFANMRMPAPRKRQK